MIDAADRVRAASRWLEAGRAVASGQFARAAETYAAIGSLPDEALAELQIYQLVIRQPIRVVHYEVGDAPELRRYPRTGRLHDRGAVRA